MAIGSSRRVAGAVLGLFFVAASLTSANDWPNYRGPDHNGISRETGWSTHWPKEGPKRLWKASVGLGYAAVCVANGRAYTTGNQHNRDTLYCFDAATGKVIWQQSHDCPQVVGPKYYDGGTSATPTVDGSVVFNLDRQGKVFCFDAALGTVLWQKDLVAELGVKINQWGFASSPLINGHLLLLNVGATGTALEKKTGRVVWTSGKDAAGYSSMVPFMADGRRCLAFMARKALVIVEEQTGKELVRQEWETGYDTNCADPVLGGGQIFISSYDRGGAVVRFAGGKLERGWKDWTMHNHLSTSVLMDGYLFGINGQAGKSGDLRCVDFKTGEVKWVQPGIGIGALSAADGKLIIQGEKGELIVAEATPDAFKPLARAQVLGGKCWTMPVLSNGRIYCRNSRGDLVCLDVK